MEPLEIRGMHVCEGERKWLARGVTYGPFEARHGDDVYPDAKQLREDFQAISGIGANALRLYTPPREHLAAIAAEYSLRLLIDIPWPKHLDVYRDPRGQRTCLDMVRDGIGRVRSWPNLLGVNLGNEAPADLIRWSGARRAAAAGRGAGRRGRRGRVSERDGQGVRWLAARKQETARALSQTHATHQAISAYRAPAPRATCLDRLDEEGR